MQETSTEAAPVLTDDSIALWQGVVRYYGHLSTKPGWEHLHPLFDFVKQLSTSVVSVNFFPALIDDTLYIAKSPIDAEVELPRRVSIEVTQDKHVLMTCYPEGDGEAAQLDAPRESALDALWHMLQEL